MGRPEFTLAELVGYEDVEARSHEALASLVVHYKEIVLIKEIMEYLESHSKEINDLCVEYDWEDRKIINEESEDK